MNDHLIRIMNRIAYEVADHSRTGPTRAAQSAAFARIHGGYSLYGIRYIAHAAHMYGVEL